MAPITSFLSELSNADSCWPAGYSSNGNDPEKPCKGSFNVRIGHDLHLAAAVAATRKGVSLNDLTRQALDDYLRQQA